jgi:hypothetical protein
MHYIAEIGQKCLLKMYFTKLSFFKSKMLIFRDFFELLFFFVVLLLAKNISKVYTYFQSIVL